MALVAEWRNPTTGEPQILGVGRLTKLHGTGDAEIAVLVADEFQRVGLGGELMRRVIAVASAERLTRLHGDVLTENAEMIRLGERHGFTVSAKPDDPQVMRLSLDLPAEPSYP
jgi:acetyltransferase